MLSTYQEQFQLVLNPNIDFADLDALVQKQIDNINLEKSRKGALILSCPVLAKSSAEIFTQGRGGLGITCLIEFTEIRLPVGYQIVAQLDEIVKESADNDIYTIYRFRHFTTKIVASVQEKKWDLLNRILIVCVYDTQLGSMQKSMIENLEPGDYMLLTVMDHQGQDSTDQSYVVCDVGVRVNPIHIKIEPEYEATPIKITSKLFPLAKKLVDSGNVTMYANGFGPCEVDHPIDFLGEQLDLYVQSKIDNWAELSEIFSQVKI